ncbi:Tyrosine-protein kinase transforming protein ros [Toxocara canis]|uniref:Tyrosine-protein kinase transforming protein ros n=1 Tax=Toxocara canis TaxID=6265 RepID=A0A0B2VDG7_TOXCA|nr:Tyrosine-protein kinase transforming protein ros [Toxocara canis]
MMVRRCSKDAQKNRLLNLNLEAELQVRHLPVQDASELLVQPGDFLLRVTDDLSKSAKSRPNAYVLNLSRMHICGTHHAVETDASNNHGIRRDISARNCLCSGKSLKLSDFGLSKKGVRYQMNSSERTPIRWTAPEVFASGVYTPKADVWAFGILVWEIFCNAQEEPYRGWDGEKVRAEVRRGSRLQLPNSAPPKAREVFAQTMIGSPDTRPAILVVANELRIAVGRATTPVVGNAPEKPLASPAAPRATNQRKPVMPRKAGSFPQVVPLLKASSRKPRLSRAPRTCPAVPRRSSFKPQRSLPPQQRQRSSSSSHSSKSPRPTSREPMRGEKKHKSSGSKHSLSS